MAFNLPTNNLSGSPAIDTTGATLQPTSASYLDTYSYAIKYEPHLVKDLYLTYGKGSITGFLRMNGQEDSYASDMVQHAEDVRLHTKISGVSVTGSTFTSPSAHNLRAGEVVKITDGTVWAQARVSSITSSTVFVCTNDNTGAFAFSGTVDVMPFSSRFKKGTSSFDLGNNWDPKFHQNYTHIIKETYDINESDMATVTWFKTPDGQDRWYNVEMEKTNTKFDNEVEMTMLLHNRVAATSATAVAGEPLGMKGVVQQIEERGNVCNDYIRSLADLDSLALIIKKQGDCREFTVWCDHNQMVLFNNFMAGANAAYASGGNYGTFGNDASMALKLDFQTAVRSGVTFHFTSWALLDNPSLLGSAKFNTSSPRYIILPTGLKDVSMNGVSVKKPYISALYRKAGNNDRKRKVEIFGLGGVNQKEDKMTANFLSECTNQVIGANQFFVGRSSATYYP